MKESTKKLEILQSRAEVIIDLFSDTKKLPEEEKTALIEVIKILMKLVSKLQ